MDVRQLKYFITVAENEHISKAAEAMFISQPTLSLAIRRLESELGVALFDRTGRNVKLNEYGKVFYEETKIALEHLDRAYQNLAECKEINDNKISILSPSLFMFQGMMEKIYELYPNVHITRIDSSILGKPEDIVRKLTGNEVDMCITLRNVQGNGIEAIPLRKEKMFVLLSKKHPLSDRKTLSIEELIGERFVANMEGYIVRECFDNLFSQLGIKPNIAYETYSDKDIWLSVASEKYISIVPSMSTIGISIPDVIAIPLESKLKMPVLSLYYCRGTKGRSIVPTLVKLISDYFRNEYGEIEE